MPQLSDLCRCCRWHNASVLIPASPDWLVLCAGTPQPSWKVLDVFLDGMDWHRPSAEPRIFLSIIYWQSFSWCMEYLICFLLQPTLSLGIKCSEMALTLATIPEYFFQPQWKVSYGSLCSVWHQIILGVDVCRIWKCFLCVASANFLMLLKAAWTETERWSIWPLQTSGIQPAAGATWDGARGFVDYCPGVRLVPGICCGGSLQFFRVPDA